MVPEVVSKHIMVDGTIPEELIGTLGGFGLSFIFVSAQSGLLSRAIISGCHTKIVFQLHGEEAKLLATNLEVDPSEIIRLQAGECLVRSAGTNIKKLTAFTLQTSDPEVAREKVIHWHCNASTLQNRIRNAYQPISEAPPEYYAQLLAGIRRNISEITPTIPEDREPVFSLWDAFCDVCHLDKALRDGFCARYREEAVTSLKNVDLVKRLDLAYQTAFPHFFSVCSDPEIAGSNLNFGYCVATTHLRNKKMSDKQRAVLVDKARRFLVKKELDTREEDRSKVPVQPIENSDDYVMLTQALQDSGGIFSASDTM